MFIRELVHLLVCLLWPPDPGRVFFLVNENFCKHSGYAVGAAAEASKTISFLPNLITKPRVRNRFFKH